MSDLASAIAAWACAHRVGAAHRVIARRLLRDFAACTNAAVARPELTLALQLARAGNVAVWGAAQTFDAPSAALVGGVAGSLLQLHDVYPAAGLHASCTVIPAALAAAQHTGATAQRTLEAIAIGYEVCNRIGDACSPQQARAGSSTTATAGALGATVAAALLSGAEERQLARALNIVTLLAPVTPLALIRDHSDVAPLHGGLAARAAVEAALLAATAGECRFALEGEHGAPGYLGMLQGRVTELQPTHWDGSRIEAVLGKTLPACFGAYGALEAVLNSASPDPATIRAVHVGLPARFLSIVVSGPDAGHLYDRLMSLRWTIARALLRGALDWRDVDDDRATRDLAQRITLQHLPQLDALPPDVLAADVEIQADVRHTRVCRRALGAPQPDVAGRAVRTTMTVHEAARWDGKFEALAQGAAPPAGRLAALLA